MNNKISLSLYIHIPWCVQKCPYCDFNSHAMSANSFQEERYIDALIADFQRDVPYVQNRQLHSIFFGGGTPSLFKPESYEKLFSAIFQAISPEENMEITLEANPGTVDEQHFRGYRAAGINRISLGIQSFNSKHLKKLGRIHSTNQAEKAFHVARAAGFDNINVDLMFGLPAQTQVEALADLEIALQLQPEHLSWYQLTLEPNTVFYKYPPKLPHEDVLWDIEIAGKALIVTQYQQYEISAYSKPNRQCHHNLNYWQFGDYLGIGAGAHGKITQSNGDIVRTQKKRQPADYMKNADVMATQTIITPEQIPFEFMLNVSRLFQPISRELFETRTPLDWEKFTALLKAAQTQELVILKKNSIEITPLGHRYLNNLHEMFLT